MTLSTVTFKACRGQNQLFFEIAVTFAILMDTVGGDDMIGIEDLYHHYSRDVFRFAFWLSGDRADAEDLTSETFVRAWAQGSRLRLATVKGFLFAITRNLYLHDQRRAGRRRADPDPDLPDPTPGPGRSVEARDELEQVLAALGTLPEADRAALLMRAEHGLAYAEIARILGTSVTAARVKVHRARLKLADSRHRPEKTP